MFKLLRPVGGGRYNRTLKTFISTRSSPSSQSGAKSSRIYKIISDPSTYKTKNLIKSNENSIIPIARTTPTQQQLVSLINSKQDALKYFTRLSNILLEKFAQYPFVSSIKYLNHEFTKTNRDQPQFVGLVEEMKQNDDFFKSLNYLERNLAEFTPKEKAILFRLLSIVITRKDNESNVLLALEIDFYNLNVNEDLDIFDLWNYSEGFSSYRRELPTIHFKQVSTETMNNKIQELIKSYFKQQRGNLKFIKGV
jgi:hypothetical protein